MIRYNPRLAAVAAAVVVLPSVSACGINTIPTKEETAKARWADVQAAYQRRADLVPNLVATVQAAAVSERAILTEVIEARSRATSVQISPEQLSNPQALQQFQAAQGQLSQALSRLMLVVERYPTIQSNQNFLALQSQLEGTENRINVSRRDYNEAVRDYNTSLRTFPTVIWANTIHGSSKPMQPFTANEAAQSAPQVSFNMTPGAAPGSPPPVAPTPAPLPAPAQ